MNKLLMAAINCPHQIDDNSVQLGFDPSKPGNNALDQLGKRLEAARTELQSTAPSSNASTASDKQEAVWGNTYEELAQSAEQDRIDAERWRYVCRHQIDPGAFPLEAIDAAIDAAMKEQKESGDE